MASNDNPYSGAADVTNMKTVVGIIDKIVQTLPVKQGDTGNFHIYLKNGNETIPIVLTGSQLLQGPGKFCTLFFVYFGTILYATKEEWPTFVKYVSSIAVIGAPEETPAVMAGNLLFENFAYTMEVTTDKKHLEKRDACNFLVEHSPHGEKWYVFPASAVSAHIDELPIKAAHSDITQAMTASGLKLPSSPKVKPPNGKPVNCWWFNVEKLREINPNLGVEQNE